MPADFRLKFWLLQNRIYRETYAEFNIDYIGAAPATCDDEGFLLQEFWGDDGIHANHGYGREMLRHVLKSISEIENIKKEET